MSKQHDPVTDLPRRPALDAELQKVIATWTDVAVVVLDIDRFLDVNATFGHAGGDRLLRSMAALLAEAAPGGAYHLSGDEFALMLPGTSLEQAFLWIESLRARIQGSPGHFDLPDRRAVTITAGVAQYPRDAKDAQGLLHAAEAALQAAKENGRNQVALPPNEEMVMKSNYYPAAGLRKLKALAERLHRKESYLLREALDDLLRKHDVVQEEVDEFRGKRARHVIGKPTDKSTENS